MSSSGTKGCNINIATQVKPKTTTKKKKKSFVLHCSGVNFQECQNSYYCRVGAGWSTQGGVEV
eukprot:5589747-Amphidinium_carterae.2